MNLPFLVTIESPELTNFFSHCLWKKIEEKILNFIKNKWSFQQSVTKTSSLFLVLSFRA